MLGSGSLANAADKLDLYRLVHNSGLIVVADVLKVRESSDAKESITSSDTTRTYVAAGHVRQILKGSCSEKIEIKYVRQLGLPEPGIQYGTRILFLRASNDNGWTIVDPYNPSLPAVAETTVLYEPRSDDELVRVIISELARVLESPRASPNEKNYILNRAYAIPDSNSEFTSALRSSLSITEDSGLRVRILSLLLLRGDSSQLEVAQNLLLNATLSKTDRERLLYGLSQIRTAKAADELQNLLHAPAVDVRRAAAEALWHISEPSTRKALISALSDPDRDVRFYSVRALADIDHEPEWGPGPAEFDDHEHRYISHWKK